MPTNPEEPESSVDSLTLGMTTHDFIPHRPESLITVTGGDAPYRVPPTPVPTDSIRESVPGFEILEELGRGGMGVVYLARQKNLNRLVALKMILSGEHAGLNERERFRREAESVAALHHPNIVQVYEVGEADNRAYLAMEYVAGGSLSDRLDGQPWPAKSAASLIETLARAMNFAHERGIVHRDLKPANVLLTSDTRTHPSQLRAASRSKSSMQVPVIEKLHPKVADFGLAKRVEPESTWSDDSGPRVPGKTRTGAVVGTPSYIAPEQAAGKSSTVGPGADIYSLGTMLYELLTGRPPFRGETPLDTVLQVMADDPVPPSKLRAKLPRDLETICLKCLRKDPTRRYRTAAEFADDLARFQRGEPITARPVGLRERAIKWIGRHPTAAIFATITGFAVTTLLAASLYFNIELQNAADREELKAKTAREAEELAYDEKKRADAERAEAKKQQLIAEEKSREAMKSEREVKRGLYALQLFQAAAIADRDPQRAARLLDDPRRCPNEFRDFTWRYFREQCRVAEEIVGQHPRPVTNIAYSRDGRYLVSSSWDSQAIVWDAKTSRPLWTLKGHTGIVIGVTFSHDSRTIATAGDDHTVRLWDLPEGATKGAAEATDLKPFAILTGHTDSVKSVAFDPTTNLLASSSADETIRIWEIPAKSGFGIRPRPGLHAVLRGHRGPVWCVTWSLAGLFSGGNDGTVRMWEPEQNGKNDTLFKLSDPVIALTCAFDGELLAAAGNSQEEPTIQLWRPLVNRDGGKIRGHTNTIYSLAASPDGKRIASGSRDGTIRLWDVASLQEKAVFRPERDVKRPGRTRDGSIMIRSVDLAPDGLAMACGGMDGVVRSWNFAAHQDELTELEIKAPLRTAEISQDGKSLAIVDRTNTVKIWRDLRPGERIPKLPSVTLMGPEKPIRALAINDDGSTVAAVSEGERVFIWSGNSALPTILQNQPAVDVALSGKNLVIVLEDGRLRWIDAATGKDRIPPSAARGRVGVARFTSDGRKLVTAGSVTLQIWDAATGQAEMTMIMAHLQNITALGISEAPTNGVWTIGTGDETGQVKIWDVKKSSTSLFGLPPDMPLSLIERTKFSGTTDPVRAIAFSKDGKTVATGGVDRTLRLWDPETGQERGALNGHTDAILLTRFLNENLLLSLGREGTSRRWRGTTDGTSPIR